MNAATYTAVTAASDTSTVAISPTLAFIICAVCLGLVAAIVLFALLDR